ncbi:hypothetical protein [Microbulbifer epialgicus]|uniref:Tubulin/FtsZ GTPase domain-containing protein n=1 Tax=Microbulbifer epialgicus TaxID=393907 RepID=A0ABV4NUX2_9GAMM
MANEIISIHIGGAGCRIGLSFWDLLRRESGLDTQGKPTGEISTKASETLFQETGFGAKVPRSLFVDLDPRTINEVKQHEMGALFHEDYLVSGDSGTGGVYARGYEQGKKVIDTVFDKIRKIEDNCDSIQGFMIFMSTGGGTGAGLGALILEQLRQKYLKIPRLVFAVYPSALEANATSPYNSLMSSHKLLRDADMTVVLENSTFKYLRDSHSQQINENNKIACIISDVTAPIRDQNGAYKSIRELIDNLVPFPRFSFMLAVHEAIDSSRFGADNSAQRLSESAFDPRDFIASIPDFNWDTDKYLGMDFIFWGNLNTEAINSAMTWFNLKYAGQFKHWFPGQIRSSLHSSVRPVFDHVDREDATVTILGNNSGIMKFFDTNVIQPAKLIRTSGAYLHQYYEAGMVAKDFDDAFENFNFLLKDYSDATTPAVDEKEEEKE